MSFLSIPVSCFLLSIPAVPEKQGGGTSVQAVSDHISLLDGVHGSIEYSKGRAFISLEGFKPGEERVFLYGDSSVSLNASSSGQIDLVLYKRNEPVSELILEKEKCKQSIEIKWK